MTHTHGGTDASECTTCEYKPKHRGEYKEEYTLCVVCHVRPQFAPGSRGIGGALCMVCYYDL